MAFVIETPNPFEPMVNVQKHYTKGGHSILDWLVRRYPNFVEFPLPTICLVNGKPSLRKDWDYVIQENDIINFITIPQGPFALVVLSVVALVALSAVALTMPVDVPTSSIPESDPVFSTKGQQNEIRLGEPIEVCYGRNRIYPSHAARPYFQYIDNDQYQSALFCVGQGKYEISAIQIGDTDISDFQEVEYEIVPPGSQVTLFPTSVITSIEVGGQTLFAPNEIDYVGDGWAGPFSANSPGTVATEIQVDLVMPKGIYRIRDSGKITGLSIYVEIEAREIDDVGTPLGVWFPLTLPFPHLIQGSTTTPQRRTIGMEVPPGRYEVRIRRTDTKEDSHRAGHDVIWEGMRAFIEAEQDWGDVTLLAVRMRATNNLNDRTQSRFNVIATRMLPIRESGGVWSEPVATRSLVWAFVDVFRAKYGGKITDDSYFDWDTLEELDALYESRNEHFDWIFRDPSTVWETAKVLARAGRATPLLSGSLITIKREGPLDIPVTLFTPDNIIGNFLWDVKLWDLDEFDCISIEYTDPSTGYKQEQVLAVLPGGTSDNPKDVRLIGVQDRAHAYREGLFMLAIDRYLRENVTFDTGLEGYIPTFGDLIAVSHDVTRWSQSGYVVQAQRLSGDNYQIWVSEELNWDETNDYQIRFRGRTGEVLGPFDVYQTDDPLQIMVKIPSDESGDFDFMLGGGTEPMLFLFGIAGEVTKLLKVVKVEPQGGEVIRITAVNDAPIIHSFDDLEPSPLNHPPIPPIPPGAPSIDRLFINQISTSLQTIQVSWTSAFGAQYYVVHTSYDGENYQDRGIVTRTSIQLSVAPGDLYVRVAAVNEGQGPWKEEQIRVGTLNGVDLAAEWTGTEWSISWLQVLNATAYEVKVYDATESEHVLKRTEQVTTRDFTYDYLMAIADGNLSRVMLIEVDVVFEDGTVSGFPAIEAVSNLLPLAPSAPGSEISSEESDQILYRLHWTVPAEDDLWRIKVWLSDQDGFDPSVTTPILDETNVTPGYADIAVETIVPIALESDGTHPVYYWRVAVFDVWGNELSFNVTEQQSIPAYS